MHFGKLSMGLEKLKFDKTVRYLCEVGWDNSQIGKAHLQFCKRYLEVHNKVSKIASRAEPLSLISIKKILNCLSYLQDKYDNSIVKQSLQISIELYNNGQNSFTSNLMKMSKYFNLYEFNYNLLNDSHIK